MKLNESLLPQHNNPIHCLHRLLHRHQSFLFHPKNNYHIPLEIYVSLQNRSS